MLYNSISFNLFLFFIVEIRNVNEIIYHILSKIFIQIFININKRYDMKEIFWFLDIIILDIIEIEIWHVTFPHNNYIYIYFPDNNYILQ